MNCKTCGFSASDPSITVCPFCKAGGQGGAMAMMAPAVWPPAPTAAMPSAYSLDDSAIDRDALLKQRKFGRMLSWAGFAVFMPSHLWSGDLHTVLLLGSLGLYGAGYGHYAASKGYARWIGWLLALPGIFGAIILRLMPDKYRL